MARPVPEYNETRWLLKALRETAHELESQLYGLSEDELRWRPDDDAPSLKEIAAHLRDCEGHFLDCLERIVVNRSNSVPCFDADALLLERDYRGSDLYDLLQRLEHLRYRTVSILWNLDDEEWSLSANHPYRGPVSVLELAREQSQHDLEHLWQARRIIQQLSEATAGSRR
jgi:hypothetical protein